MGSIRKQKKKKTVTATEAVEKVILHNLVILDRLIRFANDKLLQEMLEGISTKTSFNMCKTFNSTYSLYTCVIQVMCPCSPKYIPSFLFVEDESKDHSHNKGQC